MRFRYGLLPKSVARFQKQIALGLALVAFPAGLCLEANVQQAPAPPAPPHWKAPQPEVARPTDPRVNRLRVFLNRLHCPVSTLAEDFVREADANNLDWRLLPSISVVESGGGKVYRNNNIFGWNNGTQAFEDIRAGIREVAYKLGRSPLYRNRDNVGKLRVYNPDESYVGTVMDVMNRISPAAETRPVARYFHPQLNYALQKN